MTNIVCPKCGAESTIVNTESLDFILRIHTCQCPKCGEQWQFADKLTWYYIRYSWLNEDGTWSSATTFSWGVTEEEAIQSLIDDVPGFKEGKYKIDSIEPA
jgi:hypothetical protein